VVAGCHCLELDFAREEEEEKRRTGDGAEVETKKVCRKGLEGTEAQSDETVFSIALTTL
jgi:hypothetical protein